ncbi:MAG: c-type cytochrome [Betaproteobacteria bacterium]|nr:c-type cytochrome [Betaproteobacteria bacterium]
MNRTTLLAAVAALAGLAAAPVASADEALAKKHNCLACHQIAAKSVGPAYKEVAKKYKGQAGATAMLAGKVKAGGSGTWGPIPMPPNPAVSDADIAKLVAWILKQG